MENVMREAQEVLESYRELKDMNKFTVLFKAVGNAPILTQTRYQLSGFNKFQTVTQFLRKKLGWRDKDPLFTYINFAFSPAPDAVVADLYKAFSTEGYLIVNYSTTMAWG